MPMFEITRVSDYFSSVNPPCEGCSKVEHGHYHEWFIDLEWKDLPTFLDKHKQLVLIKNDDGTLCLEIYDGYRE